MRKRLLSLIALSVVAAVIVAAVGVWAAEQAERARTTHAEQSGPGCGGGCGMMMHPAAPGAAGAVAQSAKGECPWSLECAGTGGYIKVTPESEKIWKQIETLKVRQHRKMWELFALKSKDQVDAAQVSAKVKELQQNAEKLRSALAALKPFRVAGKGHLPDCPLCVQSREASAPAGAPCH